MTVTKTYDPATLMMLRHVLDLAWASLSEHQRQDISQLDMATRILEAAARGERDVRRLRAVAVIHIAPHQTLAHDT